MYGGVLGLPAGRECDGTALGGAAGWEGAVLGLPVGWSLGIALGGPAGCDAVAEPGCASDAQYVAIRSVPPAAAARFANATEFAAARSSACA